MKKLTKDQLDLLKGGATATEVVSGTDSKTEPVALARLCNLPQGSCYALSMNAN